MPLSHYGRKAISRPLSSECASAGMVTASNLYLVLYGQERAECASHFQQQHCKMEGCESYLGLVYSHTDGNGDGMRTVGWSSKKHS
jgi:sulfur transfer protein SufE